MTQLRSLPVTAIFMMTYIGFVYAANPVPFVNQPLVPTTVSPGGPAFTMEVNGTGFVASSTVNWNGSPRSTTFVTSSQLKASILAADIANPGTAAVSVTTPSTPQSNIAWLSIRTPAKSLQFSMSQVAHGGWVAGVIAADFNHDGKVDLASVGGYNDIAKVPHHVAISLGNGAGKFQKAVDYNVAGDPFGGTTADFNGDGIPDLAVATGLVGPVNLSVLLGNGDGTFQTRTNYYTGIAYGVEPSVVAADFNGDGKIDLAVAGAEDQSYISLMLGNGDGTFQAPNLINVTVGGPASGGIAVGDFNADGKLDIACSVFVTLGNGDGTFQPPTQYTTTGTNEGIGTADLNGDKILDLVTSGPVTTYVFLGNGDGTFQAAEGYPDDGGGVQGLTFADLNGDGKLDVIVTHSGTGHVSYLLGNGDGTLQNYVDLTVASPGIVAIADFNGDGHLDFAVPNQLSPGSGVTVALQH